MAVAEAPTSTTDSARQRILDVTAALVLEHGVAGVAQRQIAERVGIKAASLYHHFASKNEIVEAVFRRGIDVMERAWDEAAASGPADDHERLATHVRAHLSALFENGPYTAAHVTAFRTAPAEVREAVVPMRDAYEARWTALLTELDLPTPVGLSRLTLFGAMNTAVEWFDTDRGNLDELADIITTQFRGRPANHREDTA
ncbi:MAG: TetR/AcrR family transcriptional regulator [Actinomycetota bacterium]